MAAKITKSSAPKLAKPKPGQFFGTNGIRYRFPQGEGGPIEIRIDFAAVAAPTSYCYVDSVHLAVDEAMHVAILSFGRRNETTSKLADRVDVAMPEKSLFGQFWKSSREVEKTLDDYLAATGATPKPRPVSLPDTSATTFFANAILVALGEGEATLDFYHMTPRSVHLAKTQRSNIEIMPICRVIMSSVVAKHFFETLKPHAEGGGNFQSAALERSRRAARSQ